MMMKVLRTLLRAEGNDKYSDHVNMNSDNTRLLLMCLVPPSVVAPTLQTALDAGLQYGEVVLKYEAGIFIL